MGKGSYAAFLALVITALSCVSASAAEPPQLLLAAKTDRIGKIDLYVVGVAGAKVEIGERVGGRIRPLTRVELPANGYAALMDATPWSCERRARHFEASARHPDGKRVEAITFPVRSPSCRERFELSAPRSVRRGQRVAAKVRDTWRIGDLRPQLCIRSPRGDESCSRSERSFTADSRGRWQLELRVGAERLRHTVFAGVRVPTQRRRTASPVLVTGDSLMDGVDSFIEDGLLRTAPVKSETFPGRGISKIGFDWPATAESQVNRFKPRATVVFLGGNDGFPMQSPAGQTIQCCGEPWISEYTRRVDRMMRSYLGGGRELVWLTIPAPEDRDAVPLFAAVNTAVRRAGAANPSAKIVPVDELLTPGFTYRAFMEIGGKRVRVRGSDGTHLSIAGASFVADVVLRTLRGA